MLHGIFPGKMDMQHWQPPILILVEKMNFQFQIKVLVVKSMSDEDLYFPEEYEAEQQMGYKEMQNINLGAELGYDQTGRMLRTPTDIALERTRGALSSMDIKKKDEIFQMVKKIPTISILNIELIISAAFCIVNKFPLSTPGEFESAYNKSHVPKNASREDFLRYIRILNFAKK